MKRAGSLLCTFMLSLLWPSIVPAQQAVVTTHDSAAIEVGQAFLARHGSDCLAILPQHVVQEVGRPALLREGKPPLIGETRSAADLGNDLAVLRIEGGISGACGAGALSIRRDIARLLQQGRLGTLRSVNGDGTIAQLAVTLVDDDGHSLLRIQPTHPDNPIRKGLSGSLLMIDGIAAGMLLSVNARSGIGTVMRIDALLARVDRHLLTAGIGTTPTPGGKPAHASGAQVLAWSSLPRSEDYRAANLLSGDENTPPWITTPARWPVSVDLQAGEGIVTISGITFDTLGLEDSGQRPAAVEIFINLSGEPHGWRTIRSAALEYVEGIARVEFAPLRARQIRLSFSRPADGGVTLALRRVALH
ncbi:hypothetical protein [Thauera sp.]|uniref:hypothetical protein n=1 Tax=Thauera sp. TaxID=1905334 RepID=UPI0039E37304